MEDLVNMTDNDFFREATLRICSSLEIEAALFSTLQFLQQEMPVSWMTLEHYDQDLDTIRIIAMADNTGGSGVDILTPLSSEAQEQIRQEYRKGLQRVYLIDEPMADKVSREMLLFHGVEATSLIVLTLSSGSGTPGTLVIGSEGKERFSGKDADRISLLSEPFAIAMSNTLKHRSELRLYDRDFFWEATSRICGSLRIETALFRSLQFLQTYIPAQEAALAYFDPDKRTVTLNAHADGSGGRLVDLEVAYSRQSRALLEETPRTDAFIFNRADEHPMAMPILRALDKGRSSVLLVRLIVEDTWMGSVALWAEGWDKFNEEHLRLLKQLKQPFFIAMSNSRRYRQLLELKELLADDNKYLHEELQRISGYEVIGADFGLKPVMEKVRSVASLTSPVLLLGETGVGKEIIAGAIHNASHRRDGPFIKVNCGAIPESLLDSELFGHEKGAFTGAISQKRGRFERASGGTLFLDEIGELPLEAQVRLLRVLQEKEIERIGGTEPIKIDIRVIAATHRDLETMIRKETFREDLYFRLQVFPITIPPLRQRRGDIPGLVQHFIHKKAQDLKLTAIPPLAPEAYDQLLAHSWPGNVRELENAIERAIILKRQGPLCFPDLGPRQEAPEMAVPVMPAGGSYNLDQVTAAHIRRVLTATNGRVEGKAGAAELLGIKPGTLRHRMRKLQIPFGRKSATTK
jgi:transcriptional regulator with GAF, ATPase, and Fis domain